MEKRQAGDIQPGIHWGPFTARIPFIHSRFQASVAAQGAIVAGATGLVIVPILTGYFGLTFEQAVSLSICVFLLDASAPLLFGEPFVAGWITPVFPLVLSFVMDQYSIPSERFQVMTALSIDIALLLFVLGFTGLGKRFIDWLPRAVKGGILMGAAIASLQFVFTRETSSLQTQPVSTIAALSVCALFLFSALLHYF